MNNSAANGSQTPHLRSREINTSASSALEEVYEHKTTRTLRDELIQTGIVTNTPEFCRSWLGRSEGYIRVLRYNRIDPRVETLTICSNKLGYYAARLNGSDADEHKAWAAKLIHLKALCDSAIARQAEAVWRAPERMAL